MALSALLGLLIGWARGGRVSRLSQGRLNAFPLMGIAALLVVTARVPWISSESARLLVGAGYLAALAMLWFNRQRPWTSVIIAGTALNSLVILVNGGRMPILVGALSQVRPDLVPILEEGLEVGRRHILAAHGSPLAFLGDSLPLQFGTVGAVVSPGDLLISAGVAGFLQAAMLMARLPQRAS